MRHCRHPSLLLAAQPAGNCFWTVRAGGLSHFLARRPCGVDQFECEHLEWIEGKALPCRGARATRRTALQGRFLVDAPGRESRAGLAVTG